MSFLATYMSTLEKVPVKLFVLFILNGFRATPTVLMTNFWFCT